MIRRAIAYLILAGIVILVALSACSQPAPTQTPQPSPTLTRGRTPTPQPTEAAAEPTPILGEFITTRTPAPTATPGALEQAVTDFTRRAGLATTRFLGISVADWINLGISAGLIFIGYLLGTWIIRRFLPRLVRRTPSAFDDQLLDAIGSDIRWLVVIYVLNYATTDRLTFIGPGLRTFLSDLYFVLGLLLLVRVSIKVAGMAAEWYIELNVKEGREEMAPVITMITRVSRIIIGIIGLTILLAHFGVNVTALTAALGVGGLAISLAAKDTVSDAIAGMILIVDRPFRVGDRIEIQGIGTWGDVADIGLRTTRIRTRDNRMVIVPNSIISHNQVVNYSYPDPRYRIETHVDVAYGTDVESVRQLFTDTVRRVEGVLTDKPVDALYVDMSGPAMRFRLRWWIQSYTDTRRMLDRVHTAVQHALDEAGIESPNIVSNVNLLVEQETSDRLSRAFGSRRSDGSKGDEDVIVVDRDIDV
jgi:MscS family membrane protein